MKKILSFIPLFVLIIALLTSGEKVMAQQEGNRGNADKEINQTKQKVKEKTKGAKEAVKEEKEKVAEDVQKDEEKVEEAVKEEEEKAREAVKDEEGKVREAVKEKEEKVREAVGEKREGKAETGKIEKEANKGKGNAYGKNKGGLEGRDFGQARAEAARMQQQEKKAELDRTVTDNEGKITQAKEKIKVAREDLEKQKASGKVKEKEYQERKGKIDNAERAVNDLEQKIQKGKNLPGKSE